jgi:hypothetical protein
MPAGASDRIIDARKITVGDMQVLRIRNYSASKVRMRTSSTASIDLVAIMIFAASLQESM